MCSAWILSTFIPEAFRKWRGEFHPPNGQKNVVFLKSNWNTYCRYLYVYIYIYKWHAFICYLHSLSRYLFLELTRMGAVGSQEHPSKNTVASVWGKNTSPRKLTAKAPENQLLEKMKCPFEMVPFFGGACDFLLLGGGEKHCTTSGFPYCNKWFLSPNKIAMPPADGLCRCLCGCGRARAQGQRDESALFNLGWSKPMLFLLARSSLKKTQQKTQGKKKSLKKWDSCKKIWICTSFHCKSSNQIFSFQLWS